MMNGYPLVPAGYPQDAFRVPAPAMGVFPPRPFVPAFPPRPAIPAAPPRPAEIPPLEESYIENILRMNRGKMATIYMTFEGNREWNAKIFRGIVETAGRDHIIISDPQTGQRYLLQMVNLDYITFDEPLVYVPPPGPARFPPR